MIRALRTIGRRERINLPDLGAYGIEAKVDTGAFRTAIHCLSFEEQEREGRKILAATFDLDGHSNRTVYFTEYKLRWIRNSFGSSEERYCVSVVLTLGRKRIRSNVSLSNRSGMKYQVLIGRKTIGKKFLVDVSRIFASSRHH